MKNYAAVILSFSILVGLGFGFSSCKEDEPPVPPKLSFAASEMTVSEGAGVIEVEVTLDKAYGKDLNVEYTLGGTASDQGAVGTADADYEVVDNNPGVVVIESGQTSGTIHIELFPDAGFEADETITISIMDTNTADIQIGAEDEIVITITNDDAKLIASFANTSITFNEAQAVEGLLKIPVQLDNVAPSATTITYTLAGTALDSITGFNENIPSIYYDYYVDGVSGEITIPAGKTADTIRLQIFTDFVFENDETIEITLTESPMVQVGTNTTMTINVVQQNGKVIAVVWDDAHTDVDMDMFLWGGETHETLGVLAYAINADTVNHEEIIFVPDLFTDGAFGLSYVYYEGTADPMNFEAHFADFTDGVLAAPENRQIFAASYTLDNIHRWDETGTDPLVVQTFSIADGIYTDISEITVPASGSRMRSLKLPEGLRKSGRQPSGRSPF